jgi:hypothetical protein
MAAELEEDRTEQPHNLMHGRFVGYWVVDLAD